MNKKDIIVGVTGDTGFIGSALVEELKNSNILYEGFNTDKYSLFNVSSMKDFVTGKKIIFHIAALHRAQDTEINKVNFEGTKNLLEAIRLYNSKATLVFLSSFQVYKRTEEIIYLTEESKVFPINSYGISKKNAEDEILKYNSEYGIKSIIFRVSNVYGPGCLPYYNSVISTFIDQALKDVPLIINGTGEQAIDLIYIRDLVELLIKSINHNLGKKTEIINVCTEKSNSINTIISVIEKSLSKSLKKNFSGIPEEKTYLIGSNKKLKERFLFEPRYSLDKGIEEIIRYKMKKQLKIKLIHPPQLNVLEDKQFPPLNLMYIAANLIKHGIKCEIIDLASLTPDKWENKIGYADIYGVTCYTPSFPNVKAIADLTKKINPKSVCVIGGVHPSAVPESVLKYDVFDHIVIGEGEYSFLNLIRDYENGKKVPRKIVSETIKNLDELPFPARELVNLNEYSGRLLGKMMTSILSSRGCPYGCAYCSKAVMSRGIRLRSPENVIAEIKEVIDKYGIRCFIFYDDIFTINKKRLYIILDEIKKLNITFLCHGRANLDTYEDFVKLKDAGCREIGFGIESGSQKILNKIHKESTVEQNRRAIIDAKRAGLITKAYFMIGLPGEDKESVEETKKFIEETSPDICNLYTFVPLPGSDTWNHPECYDMEILNTENFEDYYIISKDGTGGITTKLKSINVEEFIQLRDYLMDFLREKYGKYKEKSDKK